MFQLERFMMQYGFVITPWPFFCICINSFVNKNPFGRRRRRCIHNIIVSFNAHHFLTTRKIITLYILCMKIVSRKTVYYVLCTEILLNLGSSMVVVQLNDIIIMIIAPIVITAIKNRNCICIYIYCSITHTAVYIVHWQKLRAVPLCSPTAVTLLRCHFKWVDPETSCRIFLYYATYIHDERQLCAFFLGVQLEI